MFSLLDGIKLNVISGKKVIAEMEIVVDQIVLHWSFYSLFKIVLNMFILKELEPLES